jgi:hypothetical protein
MSIDPERENGAIAVLCKRRADSESEPYKWGCRGIYSMNGTNMRKRRKLHRDRVSGFDSIARRGERQGGGIGTIRHRSGGPAQGGFALHRRHRPARAAGR